MFFLLNAINMTQASVRGIFLGPGTFWFLYCILNMVLDQAITVCTLVEIIMQRENWNPPKA